MLHKLARSAKLGKAAIALAMICLAAAACSSSPKTTASASAASKKITIAFSTASEGVVFDVAIVRGMQQEAKALGVKLLVLNANGDADTQATQVQTLTLEHVSGIMITPVDSAGIDPSILALNKDKIPVVGVSAAPTAGKVFTVITANTYQIGYTQGLEAVNLLKQRFGSARGNVVFGEGIPTVNVAVNELDGFKAALKPYPNVHLLSVFVGNYTESDSYNAFLTVLAAHPQTSGSNAIDIAVGADDNTAAGISEAITHLGRDEPVGSSKRILIMGADGSPVGVQMLESKQWSADIGLDPVVGGKDAVIELLKAIHGDPSPGASFFLPYPLLTPANVKSSGIWGLTYK